MDRYHKIVHHHSCIYRKKILSIHKTAKVLLPSCMKVILVMIMGHVYMGTIGTPGSLEGMQTGYVEEAWAREHHALWLEDIKSGRIPAQRSAPGASRDALQV